MSRNVAMTENVTKWGFNFEHDQNPLITRETI